jgi:hypothetical protein
MPNDHLPKPEIDGMQDHEGSRLCNKDDGAFFSLPQVINSSNEQTDEVTIIDEEPDTASETGQKLEPPIEILSTKGGS